MSFTGVDDNLLKKNFIVTRDGYFDDFFDSTKTNNNMTDNSNNVGSSFSQNIGELSIDADGSVETRAQKYFNDIVLSPVKGLPFPNYVDIIFETRLKLGVGVTTFAGFGLSFGDLDHDTANLRLWAGIFRDSGASNGVRLYKGSVSATDTTSLTITQNTEYTLSVRLKYNFNASSNTTTYSITVWVDGAKIVDSSTITRDNLFGYRVDGLISLATIIPNTAGSGGGARWYYFSCNRLENLLDLEYDNSTLFKIPSLKAELLNINYESSQQIGKNTLLNVYARNAPVILPFDGLTFEDNLIMRLDMNNNVTDTTGNYSGTLQGDANVDRLFHDYRYILDLDGNGDYVDIPDINIDWATGGFTIAFWCVFVSASSNDYRLFQFGTDSNSNNYAIGCYRLTGTDTIRFFVADSGGTTYGNTDIASFFTDDIVVHINITVDSAGNVTIYKNNSSAGTGSISSQPDTINRDENGVGMRVGDSTSSLEGRIWDFIIWNRVLTSTERTRIYEAGKFETRWTGFVDNVKPSKGGIYGAVGIIAFHYSQIIEKRLFQGSFTSKTSDYIIADGTDGIMNQATEFTTTNVNSGNLPLTKKYSQWTLRAIILRLVTQEDFLAWVDNDLDLHFEPLGLTDSGRRFSVGDRFVIDYKILDLTAQDFTAVEVHATQVWTVYTTQTSIQQQGGERIKRIVAPSVANQAEAETKAIETLNKTIPIQLINLPIRADFKLNIGEIINLTLPTENDLSITNKEYVIIEIGKENPFRKTQDLLISENISDAVDYLNIIYDTAKTPEESDLDIDAPKTYSMAINLNFELECNYLVETNDGGGWTEHASGKATVCNRAIAVLTSILANSDGAGTFDGLIASGTFKVGIGTTPPKITNTDLNSPISGVDETVDVDSVVTVSVSGSEIKTTITGTWAVGDANGNSISECGYYMNRSAATASNTTYKYGTTSGFSPYNVVAQLFAHCVFTPFSKTSSHQFRVTFTWTVESTYKISLSGG